MVNRKKTSIICAAFLAAALVLAGCSGKEAAVPDTGTEITAAAMPETSAAPETTGEPANGHPGECCVRAQWAEDVLTDLSDYQRFIVGLDEELPLVYFSAEHTVEDFKLLTLAFRSVDEDGNVNFTIEDTYTHGTLTPEVPLLARMALMGTIPNNGISYVDTDGPERYFTVNVSGYDGSLLLTESEPFTG